MAGNRNGGKKDIVHVGFSNIFPDLSVHRSAMNFLGFAEPLEPQALSLVSVSSQLSALRLASQ